MPDSDGADFDVEEDGADSEREFYKQNEGHSDSEREFYSKNRQNEIGEDALEGATMSQNSI